MEIEHTPIDLDDENWTPLAKAAQGLLERLRANADDEQAKNFLRLQEANTNEAPARSEATKRRAG